VLLDAGTCGNVTHHVGVNLPSTFNIRLNGFDGFNKLDFVIKAIAALYD
jgi:hypothetical protein